MTVIEMYIADDGTKFETEWECIKYEEELKALKFSDTAFLYDEKGKLLSLVSDSFENAVYIVAKTDAAAVFMADLFKDWSNPWWTTDNPTAGIWVFNDNEWRSAEYILNMANIIQKIS